MKSSQAVAGVALISAGRCCLNSSMTVVHLSLIGNYRNYGFFLQHCWSLACQNINCNSVNALMYQNNKFKHWSEHAVLETLWSLEALAQDRARLDVSSLLAASWSFILNEQTWQCDSGYVIIPSRMYFTEQWNRWIKGKQRWKYNYRFIFLCSSDCWMDDTDWPISNNYNTQP